MIALTLEAIGDATPKQYFLGHKDGEVLLVECRVDEDGHIIDENVSIAIRYLVIFKYNILLYLYTCACN